MRIAIMQPGYIPWLGFFELMYNCDTFVVFDDVQYTEKDWRNRNRIRTKHGWIWLTVPVLTKNKRKQLINETKINYSVNWIKKHLNAVKLNYSKAKYFRDYFFDFKNIIEKKHDLLIDLDLEIISWMSRRMNINKEIVRSSILNIDGRKEEKIIGICNKLGASEIYDSKAASFFLDLEKFSKAGVNIIFQNYLHPVYEQLYKPFLPYMSALDLFFNYGPKSLSVILS